MGDGGRKEGKGKEVNGRDEGEVRGSEVGMVS